MKRVTLVIVSMTLVAIVYVWQQAALVRMGYTIQQQEEEIVRLIDEQKRLEYNVLTRKSPATLHQKLEAIESPLQLTQRRIVRASLPSSPSRSWVALLPLQRGIAEASVVK